MPTPTGVSTYEIGDLVTVQATFANSAGAVVDPTTITAKVKDPSGTETTYTYAGGTLTRISTGIYQAAFTPTLAGVHWYSFSSTGVPQTAEQFSFYVEASRT